MELKEVRKSLGLGRPKAARLCGMDLGSFYRVEARKRIPRGETITKIACGLGLSSEQVRAIDEFRPVLEAAEVAFGDGAGSGRRSMHAAQEDPGDPESHGEDQ